MATGEPLAMSACSSLYEVMDLTTIINNEGRAALGASILRQPWLGPLAGQLIGRWGRWTESVETLMMEGMGPYIGVQP